MHQVFFIIFIIDIRDSLSLSLSLIYVCLLIPFISFHLRYRDLNYDLFVLVLIHLLIQII